MKAHWTAQLAALLLLAGCAGTSVTNVPLTPAVADAQVGLTSEQLVERLGPPAVRSDRTVSYQTSRAGPTVGQSIGRISLSGGGVSMSRGAQRQVLTCAWTFRIGADGKVAGWSNSGALCASL
ncbi:hypothetical protein CLV78_101732 [Aliiruegeria haliotis]|uniref:Uncharacterized protein n=1 Tax=Aliiruegeria haliotis TaxID=1280846 RepID=A0A2T0RZM0_9RHOB|nr:hypothetical protein [Aliiruegeria haliotis]PRY26631.1 hypothetical protein CLV78_101732 [Aliiruegeria haliotis]